MKKFYRIIILIIALIFLTTYSPGKFDLNEKNENTFFNVKNIIITNNNLTKKSEVSEKLNKIYDKNIFFIKREDIEQSLKSIDFLEKVEVKKKYPNTLVVKIIETKPVGILFKGKKKYILDSKSNLIFYSDSMNFNQLPKIIGDNAEKNFLPFFYKLRNNNFPTKRIKNFYYFQIGRWDLQLVNDKIIKFPYDRVDAGIKKSIKLLSREDFKKYNIIDLRVEGKIIVE